MGPERCDSILGRDYVEIVSISFEVLVIKLLASACIFAIFLLNAYVSL